MTDKSNYRLISAFSNFSKIFEKLIYNQINSFMEVKLSKYIEGFRKNHNTEHNTETWHSMLNKGTKVEAFVMDLSKAFDTLNHNLLLCKLETYGFDTNFLTSIQSYFSNRPQRAKVGDKFSKSQKNLNSRASRLYGKFFY